MEKSVTVQYLTDYKYSQLVTTGNHSFVVDEPVEGGGDGQGPSPYELLLGALGSCTAMTVLMYARRKGWEVNECSVHLTHDRVHAEDSADPEQGTRRVDVIKRDISLHGHLTNEQTERLLEIAQKCPIHKTLESSPTVIDSIIVGE
jgi:putative redox protein